MERSDSFGLGTRLTLFPNPEHICSGWRGLKNPLSSLYCGQGRVSGRGAASEFRAHLEPITVLASDLEMDFCSVFFCRVLGLGEPQVRRLVCAITEPMSEHNRFTARTKNPVPTMALFTLPAVGVWKRLAALRTGKYQPSSFYTVLIWALRRAGLCLRNKLLWAPEPGCAATRINTTTDLAHSGPRTDTSPSAQSHSSNTYIFIWLFHCTQ